MGIQRQFVEGGAVGQPDVMLATAGLQDRVVIVTAVGSRDHLHIIISPGSWADNHTTPQTPPTRCSPVPRELPDVTTASSTPHGHLVPALHRKQLCGHGNGWKLQLSQVCLKSKSGRREQLWTPVIVTNSVTIKAPPRCLNNNSKPFVRL